jgi:hypothetical protein
MRGITLKESAESTISVEDIQAGQYIIKVQTKDGNIFNSKMIKR